MKKAELQSFGFMLWADKLLTGENMNPHRHNEIELNYVERGSIVYIHAGNRVCIRAGERAVFWGAVPHQLIEHAPDTLMHLATIPLGEVLRWELANGFALALLAGLLFCSDDDRLAAYDQAMFRRWRADTQAGQQAIVLMEMKALLHRCALLWKDRRGAGVTPAQGVPTKAQQMTQIINERFQQPINASEIAALVGLNPNYAMSVFKSVFGMTMIDYLTQKRVAYAQQQLLVTDHSVTEIALESGFQTISHFYTSFRRLCGHSPGRYRALLRRA